MKSKISMLTGSIGSLLTDCGEALTAPTLVRYRLTNVAGWWRSCAHMIESGCWQSASETIILQLDELEKIGANYITGVICNQMRSIALAMGEMGTDNEDMIYRYLTELHTNLVETMPLLINAWNGVMA